MISRARPRTGDADGAELEEEAGAGGSSRIQTAASESRCQLDVSVKALKEQGEGDSSAPTIGSTGAAQNGSTASRLDGADYGRRRRCAGGGKELRREGKLCRMDA